MGIPLWQSLLFFVSVLMAAAHLAPTPREMGMLYTNSRFFDKARFHLERQFHTDPTDVNNSIRYLRVLAYEGELERYEKVSMDVMHTLPDNSEVMRVTARFYEESMHLEKASELWEKALEKEPSDEDIKAKLLSYYEANKKTDALIRFYEGLLERGQAGIDDYQHLAGLYELRKDVVQAERVYQAFIKKFPGEGLSAKGSLANIYDYIQEYGKAASLYEELLKAEPHNFSHAMSLADVLTKSGREDEALILLENNAHLFQDQEELFFGLIDLYRKRGRHADAVPLLEKLHRDDPKNPLLLFSMAEIYYDIRRDDEALQTIRRYHDEQGGDYRSYHMLGDLLARRGDREGSRRAYEKALRLLRGETG